MIYEITDFIRVFFKIPYVFPYGKNIHTSTQMWIVG